MKIGNVCPARLEADVFDPPPHEPVMYDEKSFLLPINPDVTGEFAIAVCKYCGGLFVKDQQ